MPPFETMIIDSPESIKVEDQSGIAEPGMYDVLCGRGGSVNTHPGNENFRRIVDMHKRTYLTARFKREKRIITDAIIEKIQKQGGRYLSRDEKSGLWFEVSEDKARDKTSQALRENGPLLRLVIEKENEAERKAMQYGEEFTERVSYKQYYGESPQRNSFFGNQYHNDNLHNHITPVRQSNHEYRYNNWNNAPSPQNTYHHTSFLNPATASNHVNVNNATPRMENKKSFMQTMAEAFVCPVNLNDIYSTSEPYQSTHHHHTSSQRRHYYQRTNEPISYHLPNNEKDSHLECPSDEQGNPKRTKTDTYQERSWSPFAFPWNNEDKLKQQNIHDYSRPLEEGQEVQLVTSLDSMSMDSDILPPSENRNELSERRTHPPQDQPIRRSSSDDWLFSAGSCHNIFLNNICGFNSEEVFKEEEQKLKTPSIDIMMKASLESLDDIEHTSGDLNGTSLVNVFDEQRDDIAETSSNSGKFLESSFNMSLGDSLEAILS